MRKIKEKLLGNEYARKWDEETVEQKLREMYDYLIGHKKIIILIDLFLAFDLSSDLFDIWHDNFANNLKIAQLLHNIDKTIQSRLINPALRGTNSANFTQFYLKNKYRREFQDKQEVELNGNFLEVLKDLDKE